MDKTKDIMLGERRFQLSRLTPTDGNQVVRHFLMGNILPKVMGESDVEILERDLGLLVSTVLPQLDEVTFGRIQQRCFAACKEYVKRGETEQPFPLFRPDGRWEVEELDLPTSLGLLTASLAFNLAPFFAHGALKMLRTLYPDLSQSNAPMGGTSSGVPS